MTPDWITKAAESFATDRARWVSPDDFTEEDVEAAFVAGVEAGRVHEREEAARVAERTYLLGRRVLGDAPAKIAASIRALGSDES